MGVIVNDFQERFYLILTGIFIASLVACNLIFQKFFTWNFLGINFELSVGIIAYPVTFLVTDLISELYGQKRANQVVVWLFRQRLYDFINNGSYERHCGRMVSNR